MPDDYETHELKMAFKAGAASRDAEVEKWAYVVQQIRKALCGDIHNTEDLLDLIAGIHNERDQLREQVAMLREALLTCSAGDFSTGHVIYPSFDEKLVEEALAATETNE